MHDLPRSLWQTSRDFVHQLFAGWNRRALLARRRPLPPLIECLEPRVVPTVTFHAVIDDPGGTMSSLYNDLIQNCEAAGAAWSQYLTGNASIEVKINFADIPTAAAGSATAYFLRNEDGVDIYAQGTGGEIMFGIDNNGATADINVTVGYNFPSLLWFDPTPYDDVEPVPFDKTDAFSVFVHEIGHGIAFNGNASPTDGSIGSFGTVWDRWLRFDGSNIFFAGPNATQVYGGPVPVTYNNSNHIGNPAPRPGSDLDHDVMSGFTAYNGERRRPSALDVAMLADMQIPLVGANRAPIALLLSNQVTSLPENTSTASRVKVADIDVVDDGKGTNTIAVSGADAAAFEIFNGDLYLKAGTTLNFEAKTSYQVSVTVNDTSVGITPDLSKPFSLAITDVNEAPTAINFSNTVTTLDETTSTSSRIKLADISVTDDSLGTNALSLSGADASSFELFNGNLYLKAGTVLDSLAKPTYQVTVNVNDSTVGSNPDATKNFTLTIVSLNVAPTAVSLSNTLTTLAENASTASRTKLGDINVSDDGLGTNVLSLTGADSSSFEILGSVLYLKAGVLLNFEAKASYQVTVQVDDNRVGATPDATTSYTLTITNVNEAPTAITFTNTLLSIAENTVVVSDLKLADISITDDALGTNVLSITGADAALLKLVGNTLYLKAGTVLDFEAKSSYLVAVVADDNSVGTTPDVTKNFTLNVTDVNEAPTGVSFTNAVTVLPDSTNTISHIKLADIIAIDDALGTNVLTLSGTDAAVFELIGSTLYLKAGTVLNVQAQPSYTITVSVDDASVGITPDATNTFTLTINDVNQTPTSVSLSTATIAENAAVGSIVGALTSTDPDVGDFSTYSLVSGGGSTDNAAFTIFNGQLLTAASFNFEAKSSYSIRVRATDQGGLSLDKQFTISVIDVNEAPTGINLSFAAILENQPAGSLIGTFSSTDADATNSFTYDLVAGTGSTDNNSFILVNGQLLTASSFNFEARNTYSIRVRSTDQGGLTFEQQFTVTVDNANESPTDISLSASVVTENQPVGTTVGALTTTDPDLGNTFTYALVSGAGSGDNGTFTINNGQLQTNASIDFETKNSYSIRIRATDQGGLTVDKQFTITVADLNETPTDLNVTATSIAENQPPGSLVGTFSSSDQDAGNTFTYALVSGTGATDNASFTITNGQLLTASSFDFETQTSYSIRVRSTDQGGMAVDKQVTISVNNVNEAPTNLSLSAATVAENQPSGTAIGTFSSTDIDAGSTFGYSLVAGTGGADNGSFTVANGQLLTAANLNFEARSTYSIRVRTTDQGGLSFDKAFTVTVINENESPVIALNQDFTIAENSAAETIVNNVVATDQDTTAPFNLRAFSIIDGNTGNAFSINSSSGQITVSTPAALNFETTPVFNLLIALTDGGGASATPTVVTIHLADVNEPPTISNIGQQSTPEDGVIGPVNISFADPENVLATNLTVQVTSSNQGLIPDNHLSLSGSGASRSLSISPVADQSGTATITVTASDGVNVTTQSFLVTVIPTDDAPTLSEFQSITIPESQPTGSLSFTVGDVDNATDALVISATSSNTALVPNANISFDGTGADRSLAVTPVFNRNGTTVITVTVSDGTLVTSQEFQITVTAVDDPPVISLTPQPVAYRIGSKQIVALDTTATITDVDSPLSNFGGAILKVSGQSAKDQLSLLAQNGIARKGKTVRFNGTLIGTLAGGKKAAPLTITLNSFATPSAVQATLRSIAIKSLDKTPGDRTLSFQITGISGATAPVTATKQVHVAP